MQTLGLTSEQKPTDGLFKRLFWPTIENESDVDLLRQQGFWLCWGLAALTLVQVVTAHGVVWLSLIPVVYLLGGIGVREGSIGAAVMILAAYLGDRIVAIESVPLGGGNPLFGAVIVALLLSNVRGTVLASRWQRERGPEMPSEVEQRPETSFKERLVNVMPVFVWPTAQYIFFPLACAQVLFTVVLMFLVPRSVKRKAAEQQDFQHEMRQEPLPKTLRVSPPS